MTEDEKTEIVAKLISTEEGRAKIIEISVKRNKFNELGEAIRSCLTNFCKGNKLP